MSGLAFTKAMRLVDSRVAPLTSCRAADVSVDEAIASFPFTSSGEAAAGDVAVVTLSGSGTHWVVAAPSPSPAAGTGVPITAPGTYMFAVKPGDKIGVAT